jgi:hypothetical protein
VHEIDVFFSIVAQVLHETIEVVALRHRNPTVLVVPCKISNQSTYV